MSAGNALLSAACCCGGESSVPCYAYQWTPARDTTGLHEGATNAYVWAGEARGFYANPDDPTDLRWHHPQAIGCSRILVWEGRGLVAGAMSGDPPTFASMGPADYVLNALGRHGGFTDAGSLTDYKYAPGGNSADGPFLTGKPDYWPCLGAGGQSGAGMWCSQPTLADVVGFLSGTTGVQGRAPWWNTTTLEVGRKNDIGLEMIFRKRVTSMPGAIPRVYEADSEGIAYLGRIRVASSTYDPLV